MNAKYVQLNRIVTMKKLTLAFCLLVGGIFAANAQDTTSTQQQQYPTQGAQSSDQDGREKINSRDLPDAVKRSLEGTEYRGWLINSAYKMKLNAGDLNQDTVSQTDSTGVAKPETEGFGSEVFVVELKNGAQTKTVRFDKDGKPLDDLNDNDDQD
jgi:hypothetical protein